MIIRIVIENEQENDLLQRILFVLGYKWAINGKRLKDFNPFSRIHQIDSYDGRIYRVLRHRSSDGFKLLNFEEFLDYVECNDIRNKK